MSRTIEVTVILGENGNARFEFYETESGDYHTIYANDIANRDNLSLQLGDELLSWLELMQEEQEDDDECSAI